MPFDPILNEAEVKKIVTSTVEKSFFDYFVKGKEPDTRHILLSKLFPEEMKKSSVIQGLQTSLGTTLWERIAVEFAKRSGFTVLDPKKSMKCPNPIPDQISKLIEKFDARRNVAGADLPLEDFSSELISTLGVISLSSSIDFESLSKGLNADLLLEKDGKEYAFDLKTTQINAGYGPDFNRRLLKWMAYRAVQKKYSGAHDIKVLNAHLAIPYEPHADSDWWSKTRQKAFPLDEKDVKVGKNFWNFVAGQNESSGHAGKWLQEAFDSLAQRGFGDLYRGLLAGTSVPTIQRVVESQFNVSRVNLEETVAGYGKNTSWKCNACGKEFRKSAKWFKEPRACTQCEASFARH